MIRRMARWPRPRWASARVAGGGADALPSLLDGGVGLPDDAEGGEAQPDVNLGLDHRANQANRRTGQRLRQHLRRLTGLQATRLAHHWAEVDVGQGEGTALRTLRRRSLSCVSRRSSRRIAADMVQCIP